MIDVARLVAQQRGALISEGRCPECRSRLVVRTIDVTGEWWGCCWWCSTAHRASGELSCWSCESRMIEHWSLDDFTRS